MHVHAQGPDGEAKFWIEPAIRLAQNYGLTEQQIRSVQTLIQGHADEIRSAWRKHFGR
jgi:hypothetical protein